MVLTAECKKEIKDLLRDKIVKKIDNYSSETEYKPFFQAIFNEKQIATASIIQSFYTSFGMSIYEQIAVIIAKSKGFHAERQYVLEGEIDKDTEAVIRKIHHKLRQGELTANLSEEIKKIKASIKSGRALKDPDSVVDLYIKMHNEEHYYGITTVKPNKEGFETHKRKLLRWIGLRLSQNKNAKIFVFTVVLYNPYYPEEYSRFGSSTLFDEKEFLAQEKFWDSIGGEGAFDELIEVCKEIVTDLTDKLPFRKLKKGLKEIGV